MDAGTTSEAAVSSDAADSPNRAGGDLHGKTKRPDKQIYVPRQKREEVSESDSPPANKTNSDENVNTSSATQKASYNNNNNRQGSNKGGQRPRHDDNSYQRGGGGGYRKGPRDNGEYSSSAPRVNRKTTDGESGGEFHSADRTKQKPRPATSGGGQQQVSRTFHNSSGGRDGGGPGRRLPQGEQSNKLVTKPPGGRQNRSNWNDDNYYEEYEGSGDYYGGDYHSGGYYGGGSRYNNNNSSNDNTYSGDRGGQQRRGPRSNQQQQRQQVGPQPQGSTDLSLAEQTKAAEAIVSQLPDLLAPSSSNRPHTSSSSGNQRPVKNQGMRRDNTNNQYQQQQTSSEKSNQYQKNRSAGYRGREEDTNPVEVMPPPPLHRQQNDGDRDNEESGHGHRGGLLFISQANMSQQQGGGNDDYHRQQLSPFSRNQQPSVQQQNDDSQSAMNAFHSQAIISEIDQAEQAVLINFQTSGLNLAYTEMILNRLRQLYSTSILTDAGFALECNRDQAMWNGVFYKLYSILRYNFIELRQARFLPSIMALVDETVHFYEDICERLADKYHVNIENSVAEAKKLGEKKSTKCARLLLQRLYISLGDLFRYRCSCSTQPTSSDVDTAQRHYETAQRLAPKNSHPFNQMAVLALMTKRRLDAVYYFCRVLAASNPIPSVSENLAAILNDACRRAEAAQNFDEESEHSRRQTLSIDSRRSEVWVSGDGRRTVMSGAPTTELDDSRYGAVVQRLPLGELAQRLVDSILNVHGRIFSKVGLDALPDAASRCLWELEAALTVDLPLLSPTRLMFLTLLNLFSVWRSSADKSSTNKSLAEIFAVEFVLGCAALIIRHARILFVEKKFDALRRLMPCVKLYADWLMYNRTLWYPPPCALDPTTCPDDLDLFSQIAGFANITAYCDVSTASETDPRMPGQQQQQDRALSVPVRLDEDELVSGFAPFVKIRLVGYEMLPGTEPSTASFAARLQRFRTLTDYLCGIESPVLEYNLETNTYTSLTSSICRSEKKQPIPQAINVPTGALPPPLFDFSSQKSSQGPSANPAVESELDAMRQRRRDLVAEADRNRADEEYRRDLMMREEQQGVAAGNVVMEVRPLVLVIDTNSIVDFMPAIRRLVELNKFTIVLPLVVISELESLSSGPRSGRFGLLPSNEEERSDDNVPLAARDALSFFEMQFSRRNNRVKAMTSEGNFLDTIAFRDQMRSAPISNDDAILGCALHYCKMNENLDRQAAMTAAAGGSGTVIVREVVLVTCDRNLRIKAHLNRVPTCPMRTLLNWGRISTTGSSNSNVQ